MPTMANLVVKDSNGTTDCTYTAISASGGDRSPALWRSTTYGANPGQHPSLTLQTRFNGDKTARRTDGNFVFKYVVTGTDGIARATDSMVINLSAVIPLGIPAAVADSAVAQAVNCFASSLLKSAIASGYAPT